ncbi:MAG TPA: hypothetical protein VGV67_00270 [Solirubrobacteraceae bacterium]|nr:hypothetical protein [Solirubrobacteraceae bacterium]
MHKLVELLTRHRLGGAALVLAGLVVAGVVLWPVVRGDDDDGARAREPAARLVSVPELGYAFAHPRDWKRTVSGRVIRLRSPEGSAVMTFSSPAPGREPKRVKAALKKALTKSLKPVTVLRDGPGRLGDRTVESLEISGFGPGGRVRALALVEDTRHRTYAITLLTPRRPSRKRLAEVAQILDSVQFSEPARVERER